MIGLLIIKSLYFFLPAYFANMSPVLLKWIPFANIPVNKKIFGSNKTWRGLIVGTLTGGLIFALQKWIHKLGFQNLAIIDYSDFSLLLGFLLGFGALLGDLVKSYYKRKAGIKPGCPFVPFDQIDFVIGALVIGFFIYVPPAEVALFLIILSPILHIIVNYLGYLLGIRKRKL
jgi:CDP-2,3-bis-(O-geranylgeranyl)-sn-glycerol synthase